MHWMTGCGTEVIAKPHVAKHLEDHDDVVPLLKEAMRKIHLPHYIIGRVAVMEVDMGRIVGTTDCVDTTDADEIVYAQRRGRPSVTRFVLNREAPPCSSVVVVIRRVADDDHRLLTAFIGKKAKREPGDPSLRKIGDIREAEEFWSKKALIWGSQVVV